jgi:hypothetical protein
MSRLAQERAGPAGERDPDQHFADAATVERNGF